MTSPDPNITAAVARAVSEALIGLVEKEQTKAGLIHLWQDPLLTAIHELLPETEFDGVENSYGRALSRWASVPPGDTDREPVSG